MKRPLPWILAALLVSALRVFTPVAKIMTDGAAYLNLATEGLTAGSHLAAPFAYRFAVPMTVHFASLLTGAAPRAVFQVVVVAAGFALLLAMYALALRSGAAARSAAVIMIVAASSLFAVRFPFYCPFDVDIEACVVSCLAFDCYRRGSHVAALGVSLAGLLFKEFLLAPLAALTVAFLLEYRREGSLRSLRLATLTVVMTVVVFIVPRVLIPVTSSFGTITEYRLQSPSTTLYFTQLRMFLAWPPKPGAAANIVLALLSFWLPVLMLWTPARAGAIRRAAGRDATPLGVWLVAIVALMAVGGTKIMVFAVYTAPLFAAAMAALLETGPSRFETAFVVVATALFNRIVFPLGSPGADPGVDIGFYGAYGLDLSDATLWRLAEAAGWVAAAAILRHWRPRGEGARGAGESIAEA